MENLIKVTASNKHYDPQFEDLIFTEKAFKDWVNKLKSYYDTVGLGKNKSIIFNDKEIIFSNSMGGDIILHISSYIPKDEVIRSVGSIEDVEFNAEGYENTYLVIETE